MWERSDLSKIRKEFHAAPELSAQEKNTSDRVVSFLEPLKPTSIYRNIGSYSLACIFDSGHPGPTLLFRAELDALPIHEINSFDHRSVHDGISHVCGHDGHMTILLGLAGRFAENRPETGKVILFFQSAEETGEGAKWATDNKFFDQFPVDHAFALHNLPGYEMGTIILQENTFSSASVGIEISLQGKTSHAGYPENGINPALAVSEIIQAFHALSTSKEFSDPGSFITMVQIDLGERAFGTSAGSALVRATIRSSENQLYQELVKKARNEATRIAQKHNLSLNISLHEEFLALENHPESNHFVRQAVQHLSMKIQEPESAFRWSEDFSWFSKKFKASMFGIGSGVDRPQLHNPDFDFPDELIAPAIDLFYQISKEVFDTIISDNIKPNIHP